MTGDDDPDQPLPENDPGNRSAYAAALEFCKSEWTPPKVSSLSVLPRASRLQLMAVLNFLAFEAPNSPPDMSPLMRAAHLTQVFKELCAAGRDDKVKLFGTPRAGGPRQQIAPTEFDQSLSLAHEDGAIGLNLDDVPMERFMEVRRNPNHWLWRDVYVDRLSLEKWLSSSKMRARAKSGALAACRKWLISERRSGPPKHTKAGYKDSAQKCYGVGSDQFKTCWKQAAKEAPNSDWGRPGRPRDKIE
jgi:hypothetical protein